MIQAIGLISNGVPFDTAFALAEIGTMGDWIGDARESSEYRDAEDVEREVAFLGRVAARPIWHREGFADWLEMLIAYDVERDIAEARKAEKREASARRRKGRGQRSEVRSTRL